MKNKKSSGIDGMTQEQLKFNVEFQIPSSSSAHPSHTSDREKEKKKKGKKNEKSAKWLTAITF